MLNTKTAKVGKPKNKYSLAYYSPAYLFSRDRNLPTGSRPYYLGGDYGRR
jgi:hypothetical protein